MRLIKHPSCQLCKGSKPKKTASKITDKRKGAIIARKARFKLTDSDGNETLICIGCLNSKKVVKKGDVYLLLGMVACTLSRLSIKNK